MQKDYSDRMKVYNIEKGITYSKADNKELIRFYSDVKKNVNLSVPERNEGEDVDIYCDRVKQWAITEKNKSLMREKKLEEKINKIQADNKKYILENRQAIILNQLMTKRYIGSKRKYKEKTFETLLNLINELPLTILEKSLDIVYQKYKGGNIVAENDNFFKNNYGGDEKREEIIGGDDILNNEK